MNIAKNHTNQEAVTQQPYQHFDELNLMEDTWGLEWNKKKAKTYNSHVFSCSAGRLAMILLFRDILKQILFKIFRF
jgi:hypothetical protein